MSNDKIIVPRLIFVILFYQIFLFVFAFALNSIILFNDHVIFSRISMMIILLLAIGFVSYYISKSTANLKMVKIVSRFYLSFSVCQLLFHFVELEAGEITLISLSNSLSAITSIFGFDLLVFSTIWNSLFAVLLFSISHYISRDSR
jgi:hypothetical protein